MSGDILHDLFTVFYIQDAANCRFCLTAGRIFESSLSLYLPHAVAGIGDAGLPKTARLVGITDPGYNRVL